MFVQVSAVVAHGAAQGGTEDGGARREVLLDGAREPSVRTFDGALLFVDVSGSTRLSARLSVEALKKHINGMFTKMITVIFAHGGDVVK